MSSSAATESGPGGCSIVVINEHDDKKYKMVIRGGLQKITIAKLKSYLAQACGIESIRQTLRLGDRELTPDTMTGLECGLAPNVILHLKTMTTCPSRAPPQGPIEPLTMRLEQPGRVKEESPRPVTPRQPNKGVRGLPTPQRLTPRQPQPTAASALRADPAVLHQRQEEATSHRTPPPLLHLVAAESCAQQSAPAMATPSQTMAHRNLTEFSSHLGCRPALQFDANHTCVVNVEEKYTLLITYDGLTDRLYLYTTLLTNLPPDPLKRLKLYETLLEGSLLGRDMAGGGIGVNQSNGLVIMSSSIDLRHSDASALRDLVPTFAECAVRWRRIVNDTLV